MTAQTPTAASALRSKLERHARDTAALHAELRSGADGLGDAKKAQKLRSAVTAHEQAYKAFNDDALGCVGPTP